MKKKIYLSKSTLCDPVVTAAIRTAIEKNNYELVEFRGGKYDITNVTSADMVIVSTSPNSGDSVPQDSRKLGRGVYSEVKAAMEKEIPVKVVLGEFKGFIFAADVIKAQPFNTEDWKTEYGILTHERVGIDLQVVLAGREEEILLAGQ